MLRVMAYRVHRCTDCGRPIIAAFGNANRVIVGFTLDQADGDHETWTHADHARAPEEQALDGPDQQIGAAMRDWAGEQCVVTKIEDGKSWGVSISDLARQTPDW
jgi:hypothetical protein